MASINPLLDLTIVELFEQYPHTIAHFMRYHMACVGCDIAAFHTVAEAAAVYGIDAQQFAQQLVLNPQGASGGRPSGLSENDQGPA